MNQRLIPLIAVLALAGCATHDPATSQRLSILEARLQDESGSTHTSTDELGKRIESLSAQLQQMQAASKTGEIQTNARDAQQDRRLEAMQQRLRDVSNAQSAQQAQTDARALRADEIHGRLTSDQASLQELTGKIERIAATQTALDLQAAANEALGKDYAARLAALNKRIDEVERMAQDALDATGLGQHKIFGKVIDSVILTEDKTLFPINSPELGGQDKAKLDALVGRLQALGTNYHLQIQGHTDGIGSEDYNYELGKARADVVKNYLNEHGHVPLLRMSVISYGAMGARDHTSGSNRRIVVQVLQ